MSRKAISLLQLAEKNPKSLSVNQIASIKKYLLTRLIIASAQRNGAAIGMKLEDIRNRKELPDGRTQLNIGKHKTRATYGSARLYISKETMQHLITWVEKIRPSMVQDSEMPYMFVTSSGQLLSSSQATRQFKEFLQLLG